MVSLVSSGDPGIYGMAGLALEVAEKTGAQIEIEIVAGISAANSLAAILGAPLMLDYAVISLSDILVPWEVIRHRLEAMASSDMVTALYNPRSSKRVFQLDEAVEIFLKYRPAETLVGVGTSIGQTDEEVILTTLKDLLTKRITMKSVIIIGSEESKLAAARFVTPRGYRI